MPYDRIRTDEDGIRREQRCIECQRFLGDPQCDVRYEDSNLCWRPIGIIRVFEEKEIEKHMGQDQKCVQDGRG